jgi:diguanylate cyclase (GGDEF)-like protein
VRVSRVIESEVRRVDVAARYGGEEIVVVLPDTGPTGAAELAERVRRAVEEAHTDDLAVVTVSIGVATYPDDATSATELLDKADWAMYRAKRLGRNRVVSFDPSVGDELGPSPDNPRSVQRPGRPEARR